ncbi:MAG: polyprenyl synthetase family protein [Aerococcus sp.]|nr:polyprenyl synthetase family protein [Aerococcus sp.]
MKLEVFKRDVMSGLEGRLIGFLAEHEGRLQESMRYALRSGGKRLRPLFVLAFTHALGGQTDTAWRTACAVEYIHTYSLIHDDLPAMDDDDYRRGKKSVHKEFDEATAILAGDALLTKAFEIVSSKNMNPEAEDVERQLQLTRMLAMAAGEQGMVLGQMQDIMAEHHSLKLPALKKLHYLKTGQLIRFSVLAGALHAEATAEQYKQCDQFATHYGIAYQIQNDLQEVLWDDEQRGKQQTSDQTLEKNTYPSILGVNGALDALREETTACEQALTELAMLTPNLDRELLAGFMEYLTM